MRLWPKLAGIDGFCGCLRKSLIRHSQNPQIDIQGGLGAFGEQSLVRATHNVHTAAAVRLVRAEITWATIAEIQYLSSDLTELGPIERNNCVQIVYLWRDKSSKRTSMLKQKSSGIWSGNNLEAWPAGEESTGQGYQYYWSPCDITMLLFLQVLLKVWFPVCAGLFIHSVCMGLHILPWSWMDPKMEKNQQPYI